MNENQKEKKTEAQLSKENSVSVQTPQWKRWFGRKWVFPAIYMAVAAIIVTLMWVYQDSQKEVFTDKEMGLTQTEEGTGEQTAEDGKTSSEGTVAVNGQAETMQWPFKDETGVLEVVTPFYDTSDSNESKQAAIIQHEDSFMPHAGADFSRKDGQTFEVVAALSGKVTRVENLPLVGNVIELTHDNNLKTVYQSVANVAVNVGQEVKQGDVIASAGRNELEKDLGVHLHFEVYQNGKNVDPEQLIQNQ